MTDIEKPKIYLAARYSRFAEMQGYRTQLEAIGYEITSRWINGDHQVSNDALAQAKHEERIRFAVEDRDDLMAAEIVIAFAEEPRTTTTRGGRHVEFGMALMSRKRLIAVGWRENVFYCLPEVEFAPGGFEEVMDMLAPCEGCGAVPPAGVDDNLLSLCRECLDGCAEGAAADQKEFEGWIADRYVEKSDVDRDTAVDFAQAHFDHNGMLGLTFGAADHDWSRAGANDIADEDMACWEAE